MPVHMCMHPELNQYIRDVLTGVMPVLDWGQVDIITISIRNKVF